MAKGRTKKRTNGRARKGGRRGSRSPGAAKSIGEVASFFRFKPIGHLLEIDVVVPRVKTYFDDLLPPLVPPKDDQT